ncbi:disease resistance protein RGA5-like isoform X2 [Oryza sativa Japonica Group]|uniref:disease resistance protein RGA5-like isoform X2 n=1 Tax=Oryza sativa subsp. japonica TaxID=39947 RepID=UPI0007754D93|nr:disease resistance protein RGA5-like isoform X2 [Oryza sativa Japonica Group]
MAPAVSASQGVIMRSLTSKLDSLLLQPPEPPPPAQPSSLRKGERKKILLLRGDLRHLLDDYYLLVEPPSDTAPPPDSTAACWAKEVRELSYDVDDFLDELTTQLLHHRGGGDGSSTAGAKKMISSMIARLRGELNRRRWIADEVTLFSARVKEAIRRQESYHLGRRTSSSRPREEVDDDDREDSAGNERRRFLSLTFGMDDAAVHGQLVGRDISMQKLVRWLADGEPKLKVASIVGSGGVGKTTLATEFYRLHGRRLDAPFDCRAFVRTPRKPDMTKILTDMLSQLRPQHQHQSSDVWEVDRLLETIRTHLQDKRYFIIIEDLWASSMWDIVSRGLPDNNSCSRILITTEIEPVALACCGYNSEHIIKIDPLGDDVSSQLFFSGVVGQGNEFPGHLTEVSHDMIKKCGGLPLAITITARHFKSQLLDGMQQWNHIQKSLTTSNLKKNPTLQGMRQVLNLIYNNLPHCLKACLLYLSIYKEDYIIRKANLVRQWMAEGFINSIENKVMEEVAGNYFDELVGRGLVQPVDVNCKNEVLSCVVHHMVLNFIRCKSIEENFSITLDHSQTTVRHADKVRRLSLHFSNAHDTTPLADYRLLRVLILCFWADQEKTSYDLTSISELLQLRYLKITGNITVKLPEKIQGLQHLQTLEADARATAVLLDIVHTQCLLHLRLVLLDLLPHCHRYIFTSIPKWTGKLNNLRILNIAVMQISQDDLDTLKGLGSLTALSLLVRTAPAQRIVAANEGFGSLKYFMFVCTAPCMTFVEGAMPSVQRLNLRFNANEFKQYDSKETGLEHLVALAEISARIGGTDDDESNKTEVESALRTAIRKHPTPSTLMVDIQWVDWIFGAEGRDLDEDLAQQDDHGFCMLPESSSRLQSREISIEEDMPTGAEGTVIVPHTMEQFALHMSQAKQSHKLVVIQFTTSRCPASRYIAPAFTEYAKEFAGAVFIKVNVDSDELESVTDWYDIEGIVPTFFFVKDGEKIDKIPGANKELLRAKIRRHTASPYFLR